MADEHNKKTKKALSSKDLEELAENAEASAQSAKDATANKSKSSLLNNLEEEEFGDDDSSDIEEEFLDEDQGSDGDEDGNEYVDDDNDVTAESDSPSAAKTGKLVGGLSGIAPAFGTAPKMARKEADGGFSRFLYIGLLIGGFFVILLGKSVLNFPVKWITGMAAIAIIFYGFFSAYLQRHSRLRIDRIGDNCYYLGLTYTLASLIAALVSLGDETLGRALLENFGIALISTAVGIIMRLSLMQFRSELEDAETRARLRLIDASEDFRQQLFSAKADFENFQTAMFLSLERTNSQIGDMLKAQAESLNSTMTGAINSMDQKGKSVDEILGRFENEFEVLETYIRQMGRSADNLSNRMDNVHASPKAVEEAFERLSQDLDKSSSKIRDSVDAMQEKVELSGKVDKSFQSLESVLSRINQISEKMESNIDAQAQAVARSKELLESQSKSLETFTAEAEAQGARMKAATEEVYTAMGNLAKLVIKGVKSG